MRCLILTPIFIVFTCIYSLHSQTEWQAATIKLEGKSIKELLQLGIALDHGHYHQGESFSGDFTKAELDKIRNAGFKIEFTRYHELDYRQAPYNCETQKTDAPVYPKPFNYEDGKMGGFKTLNQMYDDLETMQAIYPNLITIKKPIANYFTKDGNRIYYVKISDNPNVDENEPEVLYTALHHAREPVSMSQMLYYMWYLLENYYRDTTIAKLVNNRELYFVPCVNPDGYIYNETTDPVGGGMWRKNRNPNTDDIGTDLNRNYGEGWGFDDEGSSPIGSSETYRGTSPFSEIETKALREFCENRQFSIAMNYHSHGNKLIIPWGYLDKPTADSTHYLNMAIDFTRYNNFEIGTSTQTLGYKVNGVADDWMYGEQIFKNKMFTFTPEVGYAFWPDKKDILKLNQSTQYMNFMAAWNAGECGHLKELSPIAITKDTNYLNVEITRTGILNAPIKIHFESSNPSILFPDNDLEYNLKAGEAKRIDVAFVLDGTFHRGDSIQIIARLSTAYYSETIKIQKAFTGGPAWDEEFVNVKDWFAPTSSPWSLTTENYVTPPNSLTDSPLIPGNTSSPMDARTTKVFQNFKSIDLTKAHYAFLRFNAKWNMSDVDDYVQVKVADNSFNFEALCGRFTKEGKFSQVYQEPVYCGTQNHWVSEWIDLKDYLGKVIFIQVFLKSGNNEEKNDGFYIDDLEVFTDLSTTSLDNLNDWNAAVFPQPAHDYINVLLNNSKSISGLRYQLVSSSGVIQKLNPYIENNMMKIETSSLVPGFYFLSLQFKDQRPKLFKVVIQ